MSDQIIVQQELQQVLVVSNQPSVLIGASGFQGPIGPPGPIGAAGISGGSFTFEQQTNSTSWSITHNLGYRPSVLAIDYGGNIIEGDIVHVNVNTVNLNFISAETGYAYLS